MAMSIDVFFRSRLRAMINLRRPLAALATRMPCASIEASLMPLFVRHSRKGNVAETIDLFGSVPKLADGSVDADVAPAKLLQHGKNKMLSATQRRWLKRYQPFEPFELILRHLKHIPACTAAVGEIDERHVACRAVCCRFQSALAVARARSYGPATCIFGANCPSLVGNAKLRRPLRAARNATSLRVESCAATSADCSPSCTALHATRHW